MLIWDPCINKYAVKGSFDFATEIVDQYSIYFIVILDTD